MIKEFVKNIEIGSKVNKRIKDFPIDYQIFNKYSKVIGIGIGTYMSLNNFDLDNDIEIKEKKFRYISRKFVAQTKKFVLELGNEIFYPIIKDKTIQIIEFGLTNEEFLITGKSVFFNFDFTFRTDYVVDITRDEMAEKIDIFIEFFLEFILDNQDFNFTSRKPKKIKTLA